MRGGEKVLEQFAFLFPDAPIYTLVANVPKLTPALQRHKFHESLIARLPQAWRHYKKLLPLFPAAYRRLRVKSPTQCLLTSDASVVKGLSCAPDVPHVCYCHSPPRYLWGMENTYVKYTADLNLAAKLIFKTTIPYVRRFDHAAAQRVTHFIANSRFTQERIRESYGRESTVIYPPVAVADFEPGRAAEDFYLVISELVSYKRIDLAVDAFNALGKKLIVIGSGPEMPSLQSRAKDNITFLGHQDFASLKDHLERCRAFIFPGIEDFGITPIEAQAAGRPVIAFAAGALRETVIEGRTGIFFHEQTSEALANAVLKFERESERFQPQVCRANAESFQPERFRSEMKQFLEERIPAVFKDYAWPC